MKNSNLMTCNIDELTVADVLKKVNNDSIDFWLMAEKLGVTENAGNSESELAQVNKIIANGERHAEVLECLKEQKRRTKIITKIKQTVRAGLNRENYPFGAINAFMEYQCISHTDTADKLIERFQDSYSGEYESDEAFAEDMAEQCGMINDDLKWPHNCIDWERAARELMWDYYTENDHYFRADV